MTSTLIIHCDRCQAEVVNNRTTFDVRCGPLRARHTIVDLCPGCCQAFSAWLVEPVASPAPDPVAEGARSRGKPALRGT
jgi:hypothetical protein